MLNVLKERVKFSHFRLNDWDWPKAGRGWDEWCNPSIYLYLPVLGQTVVYYGRHVDRSLWWMSGGSSPDNGDTWNMIWVSPNSDLLATIHINYDPLDDPCPHTRTSAWIFANASKIESMKEDEPW